MQTYEEFINGILESRGRFACGDEYHERHHITPRCMGGADDKDNLIDLFAREYFEAHRLLALENPDNAKLVYAWRMMSVVKDENQNRYEVSPEEYEEVRKKFSEVHSKNMSGKNNSQYGTHRPKEQIKKQSEAMKGKYAREKNYFYDVHMFGDKNPMFGRHHTEESKRKNSESNKANWTDIKRKEFGEMRKGGNNPHSRMIYQYDKNGNFIKVWDSISEASRVLNIDGSGISACARGKYKTAGGYIWKYIFEYL
jgi:group I intron endonuclease